MNDIPAATAHTDRRLTFANARVAHISLQGVVDAPTFADATPFEIAVPVADLLNAPNGKRERQLLLGDGFDVIEVLDGFAFGRSVKDGYCGYLPENALCEPTKPTHWLAAPASHLYSEPRAQAPQSVGISFGSRLSVLGEDGAFSETPHGFVPTGHLQKLGYWYGDPVEVAGLFLGVPYLWGGNGHAGVDCSGLVQLSLLACGQRCPGDSDLQQALGYEVPDGTPLQRGDLLFWKGHVAMMVDDTLMIHATGAFMATVIEPVDEAIARIRESTGAEVIARRRLG
ncbi:NlpC/P60 family protein [Pseudorhodobacter ferrugineus]|uniref:C40 family peptidase n=1 Tax=Pseudorhodobacter ferrugineus TaxID=77008 RepID=UPI0003B67377|nr:NlpC/P60 family protein [Pseudorhodobacter ferrugineus]